MHDHLPPSASPSVRPMAPAPDPASAPFAGRVMIIDDQPGPLCALMELLRRHGLELACAQGYAIALHNAPLVRPDLLLVDIGLPDGDGLALCRALHRHPRLREVPIILLTARADLDAKLAGFGVGAVDYVTKPVAAEEVLARVLSHLALAAERRALTSRLACYEPPGSGTAVARAPLKLPRLPSDLPADLPVEVERVLARARDRLLADLRTAPSLDALARHAGTNRTTLGALFRCHLGLSVFGYLREQRLQMARLLLSQTRLQVQEIADLVGYGHGRDLSNAFKLRFGHSPRVFRDRGGDADTAGASAPPSLPNEAAGVHSAAGRAELDGATTPAGSIRPASPGKKAKNDLATGYT